MLALTALMLGSARTALVVTATVGMIVSGVLGAMAVAGVSLNAVSLGYFYSELASSGFRSGKVSSREVSKKGLRWYRAGATLAVPLSELVRKSLEPILKSTKFHFYFTCASMHVLSVFSLSKTPPTSELFNSHHIFQTTHRALSSN